MNVPDGTEVSPSQCLKSVKGRRRSVADALNETRRKSVSNVHLRNTGINHRSNSIFSSIDKPSMSVLQILATYDWKIFPIQIRKQFDIARNIVIDRALRLRLISCCSVGEVTLDSIGNAIIPNLNDSLELLHV